MQPAPVDGVPEAREKIAGGETTGQARPTRVNISRALEGREKATRGLAGNITGEHSDASRAPAGALAVWGGSFPVVAPPANFFRASGSWCVSFN